jgi:hypothetical protein
MLEQLLGREMPIGQFARLTGRLRRTVQKRFIRMLQHLQDPRVVYVIAHHRQWPQPMAGVAIDVLVRRRGFRRVAADHRLSLHRLRLVVQSIRGLIEQALAPRRRVVTADELLAVE